MLYIVCFNRSLAWAVSLDHFLLNLGEEWEGWCGRWGAFISLLFQVISKSSDPHFGGNMFLTVIWVAGYRVRVGGLLSVEVWHIINHLVSRWRFMDFLCELRVLLPSIQKRPLLLELSHRLLSYLSIFLNHTRSEFRLLRHIDIVFLEDILISFI